jgi:hypothetical protein
MKRAGPTMTNATSTGGQSRPWYKLEVAKHLAFIMGMDDRGVASHFRELLLALANGEKGVNPMADAMMEEADTYANKQRNAGFKGAAVRYGSVPENAPSEIRKEIQKSLAATTQKPKRKQIGETDDPYADLHSCPDEELPELTVEFCGDKDKKQALGSYRKFMRAIGAGKYRAALERFVGTINAGEDCPNRGGTFTKNYLKPTMT